MMLSVVIPVFNEEDNILPLFSELKGIIQEITNNFEIIYVDDGSKDNTLSNLLSLFSNEEQYLRIIQLSKRFGKSAALTAGFQSIIGDIIVTLDGDGQDDPSNIPKLLSALTQEYDVVCGWRKKRHDSLLTKKVPSRIYNILNRRFTGSNLHDNNCTLRVYRRKTVKDLILPKRAHRYLPVILENRGFNITEICVTHRPRLSGKSKYGLKRLFSGFFDLFKFRSLTSKVDLSTQSLYEIKERYGFEKQL
ncbi:MAG: glycosyltransferase family 2 protein [Asgard group archaeon]|nr:glycosyltransferase family 2 protein [Asgard group archaeon]